MSLPDWRETRLGDVVTLQRGYDLPEPLRRTGFVPVIGSFGITGYHDTAIARAPGVVVGRSGASMGVVTFCRSDYWPLNTALFVTDFHGNDQRFCYYMLKSLDFRHLNSGSAQPSLNRNFVHPIRIRVPCLLEQRAIACVLGALDDKIDLNRRMNQTLESIARAIFKSWFVSFDPVREGRPLFPSSLSESALGPIPKGWDVGDVYTISRVIYGAPFSSERFNEDGHGMPVIRIRDLTVQAPKIFTTEQHPNGNVVQPGDILAGMDGEFRCSLWMGPPSLLNQRVCMFKPRPGIPRLFLRFCLQDPLAFFERSKVGTTVIHLGKADIDTFRFIVPERHVLDLFAKITEPMVELMLAKEAESRTLAALRDTLLPKLLSGEIRAKQAEKMVGEMV